MVGSSHFSSLKTNISHQQIALKQRSPDVYPNVLYLDTTKMTQFDTPIPYPTTVVRRVAADLAVAASPYFVIEIHEKFNDE